MCSQTEDADSLMKAKEKSNIKGAQCRKCKLTIAVVLLQGQFPYCRECFVSYASHKFYAALGKSKVLKGAERVLVAYSGTQSSATLLHLVRDGLGDHRKTKLVSDVIVTFIDEGCVLGQSEEERLKVLKSVQEEVERYQLRLVLVNLTLRHSDIDVHEGPISNMMTEHNRDDLAVRKLFQNINSLTAKQDLLVKLRQNLLVEVGKKLNCDVIFTAETMEHLSVSLLSNLALGRGASLSSDIGFCDDRHKGVIVVRPLKDWSKKEIAFYNRFNNVSFISLPSLATKTNSLSSIQKLTEKFVSDLQDGFPATVSTIARTGDKLCLPSSQHPNQFTCLLCKSLVERSSEGELRGAESRELSHQVSTLGPLGFDSNNLTPFQTACESEVRNDCECKGVSLSYSLPSLNNQELSQIFCYGCQLIFNDSKTIENWPPAILYEIQKRSRLKINKNEIEEFLL